MINSPAITPELVQIFPSITHLALGTQVIVLLVIACIAFINIKEDGLDR